MKANFFFPALVVAFAVSPNHIHALEEIEKVTKERAKTLGLEIRSKPAGPDAVRIELEFAIVGELKDYHRVALELHDGEKLIATSTLKHEESRPGRVVVSFAVGRASLERVTLKVVTQGGTRTRTGHIIKVKEFVDLQKLR